MKEEKGINSNSRGADFGGSSRKTISMDLLAGYGSDSDQSSGDTGQETGKVTLVPPSPPADAGPSHSGAPGSCVVHIACQRWSHGQAMSQAVQTTLTRRFYKF